ncbi:hypothetical protein C485_03078 [Natrinema altunense JCM 12890]|uniref:Uncharacterized protein n=1 Tax=Natrinema altunense (strain JCM 12890 / CGMCC 1.3731 / AJ2) TaxID=1227494 RepID=L9ZVD5_NATA2|nr:hypothetical protein C485_03078 [Natrinema altunense JCM 12890]
MMDITAPEVDRMFSIIALLDSSYRIRVLFLAVTTRSNFSVFLRNKLWGFLLDVTHRTISQFNDSTNYLT